MNDYYNRSEIEQLEKEIKAHEWTYKVTYTLPVDSPSIGDMWIRATEGYERLMKKDPRAVYSLFVCVNRDEESWGRPHIHGLVRTHLTAPQVEACFYARETWAQPFTKKHTGDWVKYTVTHAIRETHLHNMEKQYETI